MSTQCLIILKKANCVLEFSRKETKNIMANGNKMVFVEIYGAVSFGTWCTVLVKNMAKLEKK